MAVTMFYRLYAPDWVAWVLLAIAVLTIAALVVFVREFGKRSLVLALLGMLLGGPFVVTMRAEDDELILARRCQGLTPSDGMYWVWSCWLYQDEPTPTPMQEPAKEPKPQPARLPEKKQGQ